MELGLHKKIFSVVKKRKRWFFIVVLFLILLWFLFPGNLFKEPTATILEDNNGNLLGARIADDGQWRFPPSEYLPEKYVKCLIFFEDRYFFLHNGVNPVSFVRAAVQNIKAGKVISGGSTITMQVIRLSRKGKARTFTEKIIETILAVRLEFTHSKQEILKLYASNAPFGGNIVGLEAACWRYFGKKPSQLSWAEAATLAVLPNSPSLIFPGKNQDILKKKRNNLLKKLYENNIINEQEFYLAQNETLPQKPYALPMVSMHLLDRVIREGHKGKRVRTTINIHLQEAVNAIVEKYYEKFRSNNVFNIAVIVLQVETGDVLVYVGNTNIPEHPEYGCHVDIITSPRSTGSLLKPYLYAAMLHDAQILPNSLVPDIPIQIGSFIPENYNYTFDGAVPAKRALSRSLNVPAVKMLQSYGITRFNYMLKRIGITTLNKPPSHYGLSIILGGAEATLWDMTSAYASMARTLNHYRKFDSRYSAEDFHAANYLYEKSKINASGNEKTSVLSASAIWLTFEAMNEVSRPDEDVSWQRYGTSAKIAWKTGTSYGGRDAWTIGCNPQYVVGVWVGNSGGEGRPGLTGLTYAAPIMFEVFQLLKPSGWFDRPYDDMIQLPVCRHSGFKAGENCEIIDTVWVQKNGNKAPACPYHKIVMLDNSGKYRVHSDCESISNIKLQKWFVLPPVMEYFYKTKNPFYKVLPPYREDCQPKDFIVTKSMDMIYPKNNTRIYIPVDLSGEREKAVFRAAHSDPNAIIYWYLDEKFVGNTKDFHQISLAPQAGKHVLTLVDKLGEQLTINFEVIDKKEEKNKK